MLAEEWGVAADVWSVTSWNELRRDAVDAEKWNLTHPGEERRWPYVTTALDGAPGPVIAVSDYMRAVQDQIEPWVRHTWCSLGTDGFGLRRYPSGSAALLPGRCRVDRGGHPAVSRSRWALRRGAAAEAFNRYSLGDPIAVAGVAQEGAGA